ncbi:helix-turn-helix transcriptional regulator [Bacillus horti]|uniref:Transcriptional regulator n=1 Tax=Caldalkalibacillus horti TaxID=77523 RepID=A0ABT9W028_9BACI|nr:helix-turn-helix domain-containing protein [Bacillus horti]MDQ0166603.1 putative transcriptional regulator [Bacillus horti]
MPRTILPYRTTNTLSAMLNLRKAQLIKEREGYRVLIREVEEELALFCGISREGIVAIKRGTNQPSLAVAMRICEYFNCEVENIFSLNKN